MKQGHMLVAFVPSLSCYYLVGGCVLLVLISWFEILSSEGNICFSSVLAGRNVL